MGGPGDRQRHGRGDRARYIALLRQPGGDGYHLRTTVLGDAFRRHRQRERWGVQDPEQRTLSQDQRSHRVNADHLDAGFLHAVLDRGHGEGRRTLETTARDRDGLRKIRGIVAAGGRDISELQGDLDGGVPRNAGSAAGGHRQHDGALAFLDGAGSYGELDGVRRSVNGSSEVECLPRSGHRRLVPHSLAVRGHPTDLQRAGFKRHDPVSVPVPGLNDVSADQVPLVLQVAVKRPRAALQGYGQRCFRHRLDLERTRETDVEPERVSLEKHLARAAEAAGLTLLPDVAQGGRHRGVVHGQALKNRHICRVSGALRDVGSREPDDLGVPRHIFCIRCHAERSGRSGFPRRNRNCELRGGEPVRTRIGRHRDLDFLSERVVTCYRYGH